MTTKLNMQNQNFRECMTGELFVDEHDPVNELVHALESAIIYLSSTFEKIKAFNLSKFFRRLLKSIFLVITIPAIGSLMVLFYILLAPSLRLLFYRKAKKMEIMAELIKSRIERCKYSKEELVKNHALTRDYLYKQMEVIQKLDGEKIFKPALEKYLEVVKKIELEQRVAAYPDENEVVLTFNELYELNHLTDLSF